LGSGDSGWVSNYVNECGMNSVKPTLGRTGAKTGLKVCLASDWASHGVAEVVYPARALTQAG